MPKLRTRASAQNLLAKQHFNYGVETVALTQVQGRVLAEPIVADRDQPPFDRVAMDGIAIHHPAYAVGQRFFMREGIQAAGDPPKPLNGVNRCIEIMTGAALPMGCTTVIRYEDLERDGVDFVAPEGIKDGANIHRKGKDCRQGDVLAEAGRRIGAAEIGMLASFGYVEVKVKKQPSIIVIATGDELVGINQVPDPHQIRRSNVYQLSALLNQRGFSASTAHLPDDRRHLERELKSVIAKFDVVILSGGVSKGRFDFIPDVLEDLGVDALFHGVAQKPGKPLWVGRNTDTMAFGLPGNPQSSLSCCLAYVLPFIENQLGAPQPPTYAKLTADVPFKPNLTLFSYVSLGSDPATGELLATPVRHAGSGDASSLLRGDGFIELPAGQDLYPAGSVYEVRRL